MEQLSWPAALHATPAIHGRRVKANKLLVAASWTKKAARSGQQEQAKDYSTEIASCIPCIVGLQLKSFFFYFIRYHNPYFPLTSSKEVDWLQGDCTLLKAIFCFTRNATLLDFGLAKLLGSETKKMEWLAGPTCG
ncbi:unnamed protein product [Urochloa humidicola]